jgi:hypothetical protein
MQSKKFKIEKGTLACKKEADIEDEEIDRLLAVKVTIKAHFQIANPKRGDSASYRFKKASSCQKLTIKSNRFKCMQDIYGAVREMSFKDAKCGIFDVEKPAPIRLLSFLGQSNEWLMNSEELKVFPEDFQNLESEKAIELAVCNRTRPAVSETIKQDKIDGSSCSSVLKVSPEAIDDENSDVECIQVKFDPDNIVLKFEFDHGRRDVDNSTKSQTILLTKSSAKYLT